MALDKPSNSFSSGATSSDADASQNAPDTNAVDTNAVDTTLDAQAPRRPLSPEQAAAVQAAAAASRAARRGVVPPAAQAASAPQVAPQAAASSRGESQVQAGQAAVPQPSASRTSTTAQTAAPQATTKQEKSSQSASTPAGESVKSAPQTAASRSSAESRMAAPREQAVRANSAQEVSHGNTTPALTSAAAGAPAEATKAAARRSDASGSGLFSSGRSAASSRVLTALAGIPIVVLIVWLGGKWLVGVTFFLALIAMRELVVAARRNRTPLVIEWSYPLLLLVFFAYLRVGARLRPDPNASAPQVVGIAAQPSFFSAFAPLAMFAAAIALLIFAVARYAKAKPVTLVSVALTVLSVLYVSLLVFVPLVQGRPQGQYLIWIVLFGVWSGDTAAYYAGRAWGRRKLTPLSPGKSREGLWASVLTTVAVCAGLAAATKLGWIHGIALGVLIAVFAPLGDLAESFWKRELKVKDLGSMLPGHGGVLDRCDSLMFAAPAVYFYALWQIL